MEYPADVAILLNAYKNVSSFRRLTEIEWGIVSALERKFASLANGTAVSPADLTMMIYGLGLLDCGTE